MAHIEAKQHVGCQGWFTVKKHNADGDILGEWNFHNLITNQGLDRMAENDDYLDYCYVGSGQDVPAFTNTALQNPVASKANTSRPDDGNSGVSPYYWWMRKSFQFGEGVAAGNLSEVGIGWGGGSLFSRTLILDEFGDPTTITVLSNEFLTVDYELRIYPKLTDDTGTVTFTGSKGGTYNWIFRSAIAASNTWGDIISPRFNRNVPRESFSESDIGSVTSQPNNLVSYNDYSSHASYTPGSYSLTSTRMLTINQGNFTTGLRSMLFSRGIGQYQIQFDPAIPKEDTDTLSFSYTISWGRI